MVNHLLFTNDQTGKVKSGFRTKSGISKVSTDMMKI